MSIKVFSALKNQKESLNFTHSREYYLLLAGILSIGTGLRLYHLGFNSLWSDEVSVVLVALAPTLKGLLAGVRNMVMEMPLENVLFWAMAKLSLQEFILRLPAAIFGILTPAICFRLFKRLAGPKIALATALLLALSPLLIQYSQELRAYSSMIFFYCLSSMLLLEALEKPIFRKWMWFTLATIIGLYFHVYVVFAIANGLLFLFWIRPDWQSIKTRLTGFLVSLSIIGLVFLPGILYYAPVHNYGYTLLSNRVPLWQAIGFGLGWIQPACCNLHGTGQLWYGICFGLAILGWFTSHKNQRRLLIGMTLSGIIQISLVLLGDWIKSYSFQPRQILFLVPIALFFSANGGQVVQEWLMHLWKRISPRLRIAFPLQHWLSALLALAMILVSIPALIDYYKWPSSTAREITTLIVNQWTPGSKIYIIPSFQSRIFQYYLHYVYKKDEISSTINPTTLPELPDRKVNGKFFIVYGNYTLENNDPKFQQIYSAGFQPIITSDRILGLSLFIRSQDMLK